MRRIILISVCSIAAIYLVGVLYFSYLNHQIRKPPELSPLWGFEIDKVEPESSALNAYGNELTQFLSFRWCLNDDACEPLTFGVPREEKCFVKLMGSNVEMYAFDDDKAGNRIVHPDNITYDEFQAGRRFAIRYNSTLLNTLKRDGVRCEKNT